VLILLLPALTEVISKPPIEYSNFVNPPYGIKSLELKLNQITQFGDANYPIVYNPTYQKGKGPLRVKVVDPMNIKGGKYRVEMFDVKMPFTVTPANDTIYRLYQTLQAQNGDYLMNEVTVGFLTLR
jgi:hypothetical protein